MTERFVIFVPSLPHLTIQNEFDRGVFNRDRDDIKVLPYISQTADNINNNDKTENDTKQSNKYCIEDYEDFARQMPEKYCDFDNFLFQDSCMSTNEVLCVGSHRLMI